jgi:Holliday junction resolvase
MSFYMHSDANTKAIVEELRAGGAIVLYLKAVSRTKGVPDLIVLYGGQTYLLEIKSAKGVLSPEQIKWHASAVGKGGPIATVRTSAEAKVAVGMEVPF